MLIVDGEVILNYFLYDYKVGYTKLDVLSATTIYKGEKIMQAGDIDKKGFMCSGKLFQDTVFYFYLLTSGNLARYSRPSFFNTTK